MPYRIDIDKWYAGKTAHERNKFVQISCSTPSYQRTGDDEEESEEILVPFDCLVGFPTSGEEEVLQDTNGREQL